MLKESTPFLVHLVLNQILVWDSTAIEIFATILLPETGKSYFYISVFSTKTLKIIQYFQRNLIDTNRYRL